MRAVVQRVTRARVTVQERITGEVAAGVAVLLGVGKGDTAADAAYLAEKTANMRIFDDAQGKMNLSLLETGGSALVVSQFTLYGDVRRGRRPGFDGAAPPEDARILYEEYMSRLRALGIRVETGVFREHMIFELVNDGPVTILLDSGKMV
jgi:D-tyrosyl-tRNA(Tyr) deacylase